MSLSARGDGGLCEGRVNVNCESGLRGRGMSKGSSLVLVHVCGGGENTRGSPHRRGVGGQVIAPPCVGVAGGLVNNGEPGKVVDDDDDALNISTAD